MAYLGQRFEDAFDGLYVAVSLTTGRMLQGPHAEDVALEALARTYAEWERVSTYGAAFAARVATNLCIDELRHKRSAPTDEPVSPAFEDGLVTDVALAAQLARLPRRQREAVALRYLADLDEKSTAAAMGVTIGALKRHLARARTTLRLALEPDPTEVIVSGI